MEMEAHKLTYKTQLSTAASFLLLFYIFMPIAESEATRLTLLKLTGDTPFAIVPLVTPLIFILALHSKRIEPIREPFFWFLYCTNLLCYSLMINSAKVLLADISVLFIPCILQTIHLFAIIALAILLPNHFTEFIEDKEV